MIAKNGDFVTEEMAQRIVEAVQAGVNGDGQVKPIRVKPYASREVIYLNADDEDQASIAQASSQLNAVGEFQNPRPSAC